MTSISSITVREIRYILQRELKPKWHENILLKEIKMGIKHQRMVAQKDLLEQCSRRQVFPAEIIALARQIRGIGEDRNRKEERRILGVRILEKKEEIRVAKLEWTQETKRVREIMKLSSEGKNRITVIKNRELSETWN